MRICIHGISAIGGFTGALPCHGPVPQSRAGMLTVPLRESDPSVCSARRIR